MIKYEELKKIIEIVLREPSIKKSDRFIESLCLSLHHKIKGFDRKDILTAFNFYSVKKALLKNQFPHSTVYKAISNLNKKRLLSSEYLSAENEILSRDEKPDIVKKCLELVYSGDSKKMEGMNIGE